MINYNNFQLILKLILDCMDINIIYRLINLYIGGIIYSRVFIISKTSSACPFTFTFLNSLTSFPFLSNIKVDLSTPIYSFPYNFLG